MLLLTETSTSLFLSSFNILKNLPCSCFVKFRVFPQGIFTGPIWDFRNIVKNFPQSISILAAAASFFFLSCYGPLRFMFYLKLHICFVNLVVVVTRKFVIWKENLLFWESLKWRSGQRKWLKESKSVDCCESFEEGLEDRNDLLWFPGRMF